MRLALGLVLALVGCVDARADVIETTRHEVKVGAAARLVVESDGGSVEVKPGAAGVVKVEAKRHAGTKEEALALDVQVVAADGGAKVSYHDNVHRNRSVSFVIEAPADAKLDLQTGGGSVAVTGFGGGVQVRTGGGSIALASMKGDVQVRSGGGSISVKGFDGTVRAETGGGGVSLSAVRLRGANTVHT